MTTGPQAMELLGEGWKFPRKRTDGRCGSAALAVEMISHAAIQSGIMVTGRSIGVLMPVDF